MTGTSPPIEPDKKAPDDWIERLAQGALNREQAIEELRCILVRGLDRSLRQRYSGSIQAEDVAQDAIMKILDSLHTFQGRSKFTTWAMSIATRIGISKLRRHYYRDISLDQTAASGDFKIDIPTVDDPSIEFGETQVALLQLLQKLVVESLSEKQQLAIRGTLQGLPVEEIAFRLNSNRNAVYKLVHDARTKLRKEFEMHGFTSDDIVNAIQ